MTRWPIRCAVLLAALPAAWQPSKARAAEEDTQFWLNAFATGQVGKSTRLTIDATQRWRDDRVGDDQQSIRVAVEQTVAPNLRIGGATMLLETTGGRTEVRFHQQAVISFGRIEARTRLEERFFDGADRMELRLRQRVQYNQPISEAWRAAAGVEWLGTVRSRTRGVGPSTDQWRFQAGITRKVSERLDIGALYWLVVAPREGRPTRISHVPQLSLTWHF